MIPYSYNIVDMGGIDLAEANGTVVPGIYEKITEAMNLCGDLILYNWKFAEINIAPSAYGVLQQDHSLLINGLIQVTDLDQITVIGLPPPILPVSPLDVVENGLYEAVPPASGFNPVRVAIPERVPIIETLQVDRNGVYEPPAGVDGYSPVTVSVEGVMSPFPISTKVGDFITGWYGGRTITRVLEEGKLVAARFQFNNGYGAGAFYSLRDYPIGSVITGQFTQKLSIDISSVGIGYDTLYSYGGTSGSGSNPAIQISVDDAILYLTVPARVGENVPSGPSNENNFGNAYNAMSSDLKGQFWSAVLQTI